MPNLSARECFEIGRRGYLNNAPARLVRDWMKTAKRLVDPQEDEELYVQILDHLGFMSSKLGNARLALQYYEQLARLRPKETRYPTNINHYKY